MEFEKVIDGIAKYIDRKICPNLSELQALGYRFMCAKVYRNLDAYKTFLTSNPFLKTFAIIDEAGNVDVDDLMETLKTAVAQKGSVKISIPLYGSFTFVAEDIDELHLTILGE